MSDFEREYYENESFWDGEMLQDDLNKKRIEITYNFIPAEVKKLVDVGCGNGVFVNYIQDKNSNLETLAIDRSNAALKYVKSNKMVGDISSLPIPDKSFDCVSCLEVIEHLPIKVFDKALDELARVSAEYIIISVPYNEILEESHNQCPSCKSIFNFELHLRTFDTHSFRTLLKERGFECVKSIEFGESVSYKGHYLFRKLFYKEQFKKWNSPICPICGFTTEEQIKPQNLSSTVASFNTPQRSLLSYLTYLPKLIWPKERRNYWILGLFKRI